MERRAFLMATGGAATIAGCTTGGNTEEENGDVEYADDREASIEIADSTVIGASDDNVADPWLQVDVENGTDVPHGGIRIESEVLDDDGTVLASNEHITSYLPPETTLRYFHEGAFEMDEFDSLEHDVTDAHAQVRSTKLEDITVTNTSLSAGGDLINVVGDLDLADSDHDRVVVIAPIWDEAGRLRGTGTYIENSPTESFEFSADSSGFRAPGGAEPIDSYDVYAFDGFP
ncbi:uncharacterized protein NP_6254A (plasmid) [Natronomonas pharaonis DSM 2160]|uniref:Uncharacterized protein n=1 Tax=Natronomonas pharaonis (strain ATCC 35678 / DSM 2160 / CIP 103997 / JCM 8858 / NBRC 14720 / NCIMB 2260 / Gabara) TaxID=348780 RepID=Q3ILW3_NATPD|nr:hypothetical protein [Natronomonas pharaonis]CAI50907.1 uncharacterized protein NP_6254A [Natronomonas pharaonis DSM 2160]